MKYGPILAVLLLAALALPSLRDPAPSLTLELTEHYDDADPFVNEKLFCVSRDLAALDLKAAVHLDGGRGLLEIADNETGAVYWSRRWDGPAEERFPVSLTDLSPGKEYVVRFTGTEIRSAKVSLRWDSPFVHERTRPARS